MEHTVYILFSEKLNKNYIGYTTDLNQRLIFHINAKKEKFTYNAEDWKLIFSLKCNSKEQGLLIEKHIKKMKSKIYIQNLIKYPEMSLKLLDRYCC